MLPDTSCYRYSIVTVAQVPKRGGSQSTKLLQSNYGTGTVVNRSMFSQWLSTPPCISSVRNMNGVRRLCSLRKLDGVSSLRQGFGSFHSADIEDLIGDGSVASGSRIREVSDTIARSWRTIASSCPYGSSLRREFFSLSEPWTFLNHGAFGAVLRPLSETSQRWRQECEQQPLKFFDRDLFPMIAYSLRQSAEFMNCPPTELYPVQNVTNGLNVVLQSVRLSEGDEVVCFSLTYGSTKKMLQDLCNRSGAVLNIIRVPLPIANSDDIVQALRSALTEKTRMVIIDQITSNTGLVMPTVQLAGVAKAAGALVVVDAAHAMGSTHVSIYPPSSHTVTCESITTAARDTGSNGDNKDTRSLSEVADVWLTNAHKWFSGPKGCALMWVRPSIAPHLRPAIVSHGFTAYTGNPGDRCADLPKLSWWHESTRRAGDSAGAPGATAGSASGAKSKLLSALVWDGCRDYSALLSLPVSYAVWAQLRGGDGYPSSDSSGCSTEIDDTNMAAVHVGLEGSRAYMRHLLHDQAVPVLQQEWQLQESDFPAPKDMRVESPMALVCAHPGCASFQYH
jgi:CxxC motif-containing protein